VKSPVSRQNDPISLIPTFAVSQETKVTEDYLRIEFHREILTGFLPVGGWEAALAAAQSARFALLWKRNLALKSNSCAGPPLRCRKTGG
jgi:hypothetical protein